LIPTLPPSFATSSALIAPFYPVWGTCPPTPSPTPTLTPTSSITPTPTLTPTPTPSATP
jgi:hypothetical protein